MDAQTKTLWMGNIEHWMDENFILGLYSSRGIALNSVKIVRNATNPTGLAYAFVDFLDRATAERVLTTLNNAPHGSGSSGTFRLNWATHSAGPRMPGAPSGVEHSLFIGDLGPSVTDALLGAAFSSYRSVKSARVVVDHGTGLSKGFGFVKFTAEDELNRALVEMQGALIGERTVRVSHALPRDQPQSASGASAQWYAPSYAPSAPNSYAPSAPNSYAPSAYYPAQYSYYPEYYAPYYESYYSHAPSAVQSRDNGSDAAPSPEVASEARDWQPFSVERDNEQFVATQLHVLGRYHARPRV